MMAVFHGTNVIKDTIATHGMLIEKEVLPADPVLKKPATKKRIFFNSADVIAGVNRFLNMNGMPKVGFMISCDPERFKAVNKRWDMQPTLVGGDPVLGVSGEDNLADPSFIRYLPGDSIPTVTINLNTWREYLHKAMREKAERIRLLHYTSSFDLEEMEAMVQALFVEAVYRQ